MPNLDRLCMLCYHVQFPATAGQEPCARNCSDQNTISWKLLSTKWWRRKVGRVSHQVAPSKAKAGRMNALGRLAQSAILPRIKDQQRIFVHQQSVRKRKQNNLKINSSISLNLKSMTLKADKYFWFLILAEDNTAPLEQGTKIKKENLQGWPRQRKVARKKQRSK